MILNKLIEFVFEVVADQQDSRVGRGRPSTHQNCVVVHAHDYV